MKIVVTDQIERLYSCKLINYISLSALSQLNLKNSLPVVSRMRASALLPLVCTLVSSLVQVEWYAYSA